VIERNQRVGERCSDRFFTLRVSLKCSRGKESETSITPGGPENKSGARGRQKRVFVLFAFVFYRITKAAKRVTFISIVHFLLLETAECAACTCLCSTMMEDQECVRRLVQTGRELQEVRSLPLPLPLPLHLPLHLPLPVPVCVQKHTILSGTPSLIIVYTSTQHTRSALHETPVMELNL